MKFELDEMKTCKAFIGILQDITEREKSEEKIINSEAQIRNFAKTSNHVWKKKGAHIAREIHDELARNSLALK